ncbi:HlyD family secretion protein [Flavobacterium sp.]|jgi:multidrug resistance efflux pump|uniref:HlyD family secretion protein n=1 Tax=Flavobacterium sp. TaxID=239 RepID=UPI0037C19624
MNFSSDPINTLENLTAKNKTKSKNIYFVVVVAIILILALLPIIKIDISSQSRGIIKSYKENVPLATIVSGKIVWLKLKNNQTVTKGDTILKISTQALETDKEIQDTLSNSTSLILQDITSVLNGKTNQLKTSIVREDYYKYVTRRSELLSKVSQAQINFNRNKILFDKGVIAKVEYEKYLFELRFANEAIASYDKNQKSNWENQKRELQDKIKNLKGSIQKINIESNNYFLLAPETGTIENFNGLQVGSFLNASQPIATISPDDNLIVESTVLPNDIGLIKKNQKVKFQLDAFNYNQWGLLDGKVIDIDKNITIQENQAFFKVRCSLNSKILKLKSGYKTQVSKGMTLTTRYIITRRSLFDLLFDKVDDWLNPKQII